MSLLKENIPSFSILVRLFACSFAIRINLPVLRNANPTSGIIFARLQSVISTSGNAPASLHDEIPTSRIIFASLQSVIPTSGNAPASLHDEIPTSGNAPASLHDEIPTSGNIFLNLESVIPTSRNAPASSQNIAEDKIPRPHRGRGGSRRQEYIAN